ncbi:ATP-binding protein [Pseudomonas sp. 5P_3.1_Bac2]|uniref:ATP-binding protein n=1 Tax=Pseudomonas sp. 5P_3.1_Bac2 TaxID=2971617 RepID=UPI0021C72AAD|nr:ATP-binding protein [Pseudomonas sp. 5P_3.1_Bac2]MCU1717103.1 ATP-binding protein [Pseudomonas sp. 5P_3.1_Bac2]
MYDAQLYLYKREALLTHLNRGVLYQAVEPLQSMGRLDHPLSAHSYINQPLGDPAKRWSLLLSGRDVRELDDKRLNLLYVDSSLGQPVYRLHESFAGGQDVPSSVLERLANWDAEGQPGGVRWLSDDSGAVVRVYLFTRISDSLDAGWLGIEARGSDVKKALNVPVAGNFQLLDQDQHQVVGSQLIKPGKTLGDVWKGDSFAFAGLGPLPARLELLKHLGSSGWGLIYYVELRTLMAPLWWPVTLAWMLGCGAWIVIWRLCRRIETRLINPAQRRLEALAENENFLRAVIDASPVALCVLRRADGKVALENRLAQKWLGDVEARQSLYDWVVSSFSSHNSNGFEEVGLIDDRHLYLSYMPTRYQREEVLFCAFSDISVRKEVEAQLARAKQLADSANEAKTQFLATMSHEIRTPLYGVLGTLELLGRTTLDNQQQSYLYAIQRSSTALQQLISDVLDVAKIEAGKLVLRIVEFSPLELLQEVMQGYAASARSKGLQFYFCADAQIPERVRGDVNCLRQVLNNLLSNAVKFTDSGRVVLRVRMESRSANQLTLIWQVTDTGMGISAAEQPRLFKPFYQVASQPQRAGGTGLGLSICMRLAELMQGQLSVISELGLGSSFNLRVPLEVISNSSSGPSLSGALIHVHTPVRELSDNICSWLNRWGAKSQVIDGRYNQTKDALLLEMRLDAGAEPCLPEWQGRRVVICDEGAQNPGGQGREWLVGPYDLGILRRAITMALGEQKDEPIADECNERLPMLGLRLLVAEDSIINQLIIREQLEALGCCVELVSDGLHALESWQAAEYDAVLTDINMPGMNGYELATELRRRGCSAPIIGATANAMQDENDRCLQAGMNLCLVKPIDLNALANCLATIQAPA